MIFYREFSVWTLLVRTFYSLSLIILFSPHKLSASLRFLRKTFTTTKIFNEKKPQRD